MVMDEMIISVLQEKCRQILRCRFSTATENLYLNRILFQQHGMEDAMGYFSPAMYMFIR